MISHIPPAVPFLMRSLVCYLLLAGCEPATSSKPAGVTVSVDAVNYMHDWVVQYTLTDLRTNEPVGGAIVGALEGPGGKGCCVTLPQRWQPGIKLRVTWEEGDMENMKPEKYQRDLELPRYEAPGDVYVLFYPAQQVEVRVSAVEPGQPGWAGRIKLPPWPACVQRLGEKTCRKMMPKYAIGSPEYDAYSMRKGCTPEALAKTDKEFPHLKQANRDACVEMQKMCKEWVIKDKEMCEFDYKEEK